MACRMIHELPYYGKAVFEQRAGEDVVFSLQNIRAQSRAGRAGLVVAAPEWQSSSQQQDWGRVEIVPGKEPVRLDNALSRRLMLALHEGLSPQFRSLTETAAKGRGAKDEPALLVAVSPVNFQPAYRQYNACLAQLLPVNFEQVSLTTLLFSPRQESLNDEVRRQLDAITLYLKNDNSIQTLLVDGHNDNVGLSVESMQISEKRAKAVADYLVKAGVKPEQVVTRWHGARYPAVSNATSKGRAQNRRVTVRLSHEPPPPAVESQQASEPADKTAPAAEDAVTPPVGLDNPIKLPSLAPAGQAGGDSH